MASATEARARVAVAALEAAAWFAPSAAFLWAYLARTGAPPAAASAHLQVVFALAAGTLALRCAMYVAAGHRVAAWTGGAATALGLTALWLYYVAALVGLGAWGDLVSWSLVVTYVRQAAYLPDVLGAGAWALVAGALLVPLLLAWAFRAVYRRGDWLAWAAGRLGRPVAALAVLATAVAVGAFFLDFVADPPTQRREPLALTFHPESIERKFRRQSEAAATPVNAERTDYARALSPQAPGTNVIVVVADALRSRNMGVYGYARPTTPYLSQLVDAGTARRIRRAVSVCSQSSCGLLGIASARYVHQLTDSPMTLPEVLRLHGYRAHMVLGGDHTNFYGLRRAYGEVDSYFDGSMAPGYMNDDALVLDAVRRLRLASTKGNYLQVHLMSSHLLGRRSVPDRFGASRSYYSGLGGLAGAQHRAEFVNFYDAGVHDADEVIRRLLAVLREKGLLEDAIVVVTGDHGEFVGEHGLFGHAKSVRAEVLDIPMLLAAFGPRAPLRVEEDQLASQVDIAPTVLAHLGLPAPRSWSGVALQSGQGTAGERLAFFQQGAEYGLVARKPDGRTWKYWIDADSGHEYAYDLAADPGETTNRSADLDPSERKRWRWALLPLEASVRASVAAR